MKTTYLIRTNSLDADERFIKTYAFLVRQGVETDVFAIVKTRSKEYRAQGWKEHLLALRSWFPSGNLLVFKYLELILRAALFMVTHRGRRWYANFDFMVLHLLTATFASRHARPIFDLHEMPNPIFMHRRLPRALFAYLLRNSHVIVCNASRRDALQDCFGVDLSDALILRNMPSEKTFEKIQNSRAAWLASDTSRVDVDIQEIVLVGGDTPGRFVRESAKVIAALRDETGRDLRLNVIGGTPLTSSYQFVSNTGFIPFNTLAERCVEGGVSLCFYERTSLNNLLCEPNRFYQAICAGQYVLTFDHPTLNEVKYAFHEVIDEKDFDASLRACLIKVLNDNTSAAIRLKTANASESFIFEQQYDAFHKWYPA